MKGEGAKHETARDGTAGTGGCMHNGRLRLQWIASALLTWLPSLRRSLDTVGERSNIPSEGVPFVSIRACLRTPSISS